MSGGAYGYMGRVDGMDEVLQKAGWLPELAQALRERGHEDAAAETQGLYDRLMAEPQAFGALVKVWGAVDYHASGDYSADQVVRAVEAWREASSTIPI